MATKFFRPNLSLSLTYMCTKLSGCQRDLDIFKTKFRFPVLTLELLKSLRIAPGVYIPNKFSGGSDVQTGLGSYTASPRRLSLPISLLSVTISFVSPLWCPCGLVTVRALVPRPHCKPSEVRSEVRSAIFLASPWPRITAQVHIETIPWMAKSYPLHTKSHHRDTGQK